MSQLIVGFLDGHAGESTSPPFQAPQTTRLQPFRPCSYRENSRISLYSHSHHEDLQIIQNLQPPLDLRYAEQLYGSILLTWAPARQWTDFSNVVVKDSGILLSFWLRCGVLSSTTGNGAFDSCGVLGLTKSMAESR